MEYFFVIFLFIIATIWLIKVKFQVSIIRASFYEVLLNILLFVLGYIYFNALGSHIPEGETNIGILVASVFGIFSLTASVGVFILLVIINFISSLFNHNK